MSKRRAICGAAAILLALAPLGFLSRAGAVVIPNGAAAFASGTIFHADLLRSGDTRVVDAEVAPSGAAFDGDGFASRLVNEVGRQFVPQAADKTAFGRGSGLELGLGTTPTDENQLILAGTAQQSAPPRLGAVTKEIGPADLAPLAWADLLRGQAGANTTEQPCALGADASRSLGYIADVQLLDTQPDAKTKPEVGGLHAPLVALDATDPARAVSQSTSRTLFVSQKDEDGKLLGDKFGVMSEVRETIAPITLFRGTDDEITFEFLGEWVLQSVATGLSKGSYVHYGPDKATPETPILRIINADGIENVLTMQQVFGDEGFSIEIPGVAEISIGEPARAIGGAFGSKPVIASDGTKAAAAVDVLRVQALPGADAQLADVRLGHMETSSEVPAGGVECAIPVTKTPSASSVDVGDTFDVDFTISNPYDCTLSAVNLTDAITTEGGARFEVLSTEPSAPDAVTGVADSGDLSWTNIGDIAPGESRKLTAHMKALGGGGGRILDTATADASLADCAQEGATIGGVNVGVVGTGLAGSDELRNPTVETKVLSASGENRLPSTGMNILGIVLSGLSMTGLGLAGIRMARRLH